MGAAGTEKSSLAEALTQAVCKGDAPNTCDVVVATPLIQALTRDLSFQDTSFYAQALVQHRQYALTLLTGLDLQPPTAGLHTPSNASMFDDRMRQLLDNHAICYTVVYGTGSQRVDAALQAITHYLTNASDKPATSRGKWHWNCDTCSDAVCEHQLFRQLVQQDSMRA